MIRHLRTTALLLSVMATNAVAQPAQFVCEPPLGKRMPAVNVHLLTLTRHEIAEGQTKHTAPEARRPLPSDISGVSFRVNPARCPTHRTSL